MSWACLFCVLFCCSLLPCRRLPAARTSIQLLCTSTRAWSRTRLNPSYLQPDGSPHRSYIKQCLGSPTPAEHEAVVAERDGLQKQLEEANQLIAELQARIQQLETQAETA